MLFLPHIFVTINVPWSDAVCLWRWSFGTGRKGSSYEVTTGLCLPSIHKLNYICHLLMFLHLKLPTVEDHSKKHRPQGFACLYFASPDPVCSLSHELTLEPRQLTCLKFLPQFTRYIDDRVNFKIYTFLYFCYMQDFN